MEPTSPTHQPLFTPIGQLTPAGRDAIASTRAIARRARGRARERH